MGRIYLFGFDIAALRESFSSCDALESHGCGALRAIDICHARGFRLGQRRERNNKEFFLLSAGCLGTRLRVGYKKICCIPILAGPKERHMNNILPALAFEMGLLGFAIALIYYGMAIRLLGRVTQKNSAVWALPFFGTLFFAGAVALHFWGTFVLDPQLLQIEIDFRAVLTQGNLDELGALQRSLDSLISLKGWTRDISLSGMFLGGVFAMIAGGSHWVETSK